MKFSRVWLQQWLQKELVADELVKKLTMAGLEVDGVLPVANDFTKVVVGEVTQCEKHPDADRLSVCQVNIGQQETVQIVCGAKNVRPNLRVATALVGARLSPEFKIKKTKLRGVASNGMLCSTSELGLSESSEGIFELAADAPIGEDIREYLQLNDDIIEVDLTPNRGDCLGMAGLAREVSVLEACDYHQLEIAAELAIHKQHCSIELQAGEACPSYAGRIIKNVNGAAQTPQWMQERLRRAGIRTIDAIVDVTNYVMLELGQPMHAFDLATLNDGIIVRMASQNEPLTLLGGQEISLQSDCLVVADSQKAIALAGIMGGEQTSVSSKTQDIFLESAFFAPLAIAGRSRRFGLHTDSSHRFERGVDPSLPIKAIERASSLLLEIVGGELGPVTHKTLDDLIPQAKSITLRPSRVVRVLGHDIKTDTMLDILVRLGMSAQMDGDKITVLVPAARFDITIESDLIEEIARVYGYDKLPSQLPNGDVSMQAIAEANFDIDHYRRVLVDNGYHETISYSFTDEDSLKCVSPDVESYALLNPLSPELSHMRNSLLPGLLKVLNYNQNRQQQRLYIFETGLRFVPQGDSLLQEPMLAGLAMGTAHPETWSEPSRDVDFYDVKAIIETMMHARLKETEYRVSTHPAFHPGQAAEIVCEEESIGHVGSIHPRLMKTFDLRGPIVMFELKLSSLAYGELPSFRPISKFPTIRRDLSLLLNQDISAQNLTECIRLHAGDALQDIQIFDQYMGDGISSDQKSISLGIILQDLQRTLTDEEVSATITNIISGLENSLGATLRT